MKSIIPFEVPDAVRELETEGFFIRPCGELDVPEASLILAALDAHFGGVIGHKHAKDGIVHLTNDPTVYTDNVIRPQSDTGHQHPHTDGVSEIAPPRVMSILCINPAKRGGESTLVDFSKVAKSLSTQALVALHQPGAIKVQRGSQIVYPPVFAPNGRGGTTARFSNHEYNDSRPGNVGAEHGFNAVDQYLKNPENQLVLPLQPGELVVIDNDRMAHGRNAFTTEQDNPRLLLRRWHTGFDGQETIVDTGIKRLLIPAALGSYE